MRAVLRCIPEEYGRYRYLLEYALGPRRAPRLTVILKNPSTADRHRSDLTADAVTAWAEHHGYATLSLVNLFAYRSPVPSDLNGHPYAELVGPRTAATSAKPSPRRRPSWPRGAPRTASTRSCSSGASPT
jgi:hypothetical protein